MGGLSNMKMLVCPKFREEVPLAPMPEGDLFSGHLKHIRKDILNFFQNARDEHGDIFRLHFFGMPAFVISSPELIKTVLHEKNKIYSKRHRVFEIYKEVIGNGLLTSEGDFWLRQRRIAQPAFHRAKIAKFDKTFVEVTKEACDLWKEGNVIDVHREMMNITSKVVCKTLFGSGFEEGIDSITEAVNDLLYIGNKRTRSIMFLPSNIPTQDNIRFTKAIKTLKQMITSIIESKRKNLHSVKDTDLLTMLIQATDSESGQSMTNEQLFDEVMTIFLAGHETTANTLVWTFYLLSQHPNARKKMEDELDELLDLKDLSTNKLESLPFTEQVILESMRIYPPVWNLIRSPEEDDTLGGYYVPKGSTIFISTWLLHRNSKYWERPLNFDPNRFTSENRKAMNRFQYIPFGGGPRACIGQSFALIESRLILSTIAQKFRLECLPNDQTEPEPEITLRPKGALHMKVVKR